jgi:flagellar biosynthetic protein FliO
MLQQLSAIVLVLFLLFAALWLLRRKGIATFSLPATRGANRARRMQVIERVSLTAQHSLHLVSLPDRLIVVGVSPSGFSKIASLSGSPAAEIEPQP